jgi:Flp pilus assembly protein TadD
MRLPLALTLALLTGTPAATWAVDSSPPSPPAPPSVERELREARALIQREAWAEALTVLRTARERDSRQADVHNLIGYASRKSGQLEQAFSAYRTALSINPRHWGAHEYIGEAYLMARQPDKAREHLAILRQQCGERCEETQDLARAIAAYRD